MLTKLAQRIREEFENAPALRLTVDEASRFWAIDERTSGQVLAFLLTGGVLAKGVDQRYGLREGGYTSGRRCA